MSAAYFKITNMDDNVTESSRLEPSERVVATKGGCSLLKRCSTGWEGVHGVWRVKVGGRAWRQAGWSPGELARTLFVPSPSCAPWAGHHLHHGHQHHVQHTHISQWQCPVCSHEDFLGQLVKSIKFNVALAMIFCEERSLPIVCLQSNNKVSDLMFVVCSLSANANLNLNLAALSWGVLLDNEQILVTGWHEQSLNVLLSSFSIPRLEKRIVIGILNLISLFKVNVRCTRITVFKYNVIKGRGLIFVGVRFCSK